MYIQNVFKFLFEAILPVGGGGRRGGRKRKRKPGTQLLLLLPLSVRALPLGQVPSQEKKKKKKKKAFSPQFKLTPFSTVFSLLH